MSILVCSKEKHNQLKSITEDSSQQGSGCPHPDSSSPCPSLFLDPRGSTGARLVLRGEGSFLAFCIF